MFPVLKAGQEVLVNPDIFPDDPPQIGEIVVAKHPHRFNFYLIKRVTQITAHGDYWLEGDNSSESTDSRHFGAIAPQNILGRVTSIFGV